jgi:hypothetical protein
VTTRHNLRSEPGHRLQSLGGMGASRDIHRQLTMKTQTAIMKFIAAVSKAVAVIMVPCVVSGAEEQETGKPETPPNVAALAGSYFRGRGLGYNLHLTLEANSKYKAKWHSCLYKSGEASGDWSLSDKRITLTPPMEGEMLQSRVESLEVLAFKGQWILLPTDQRDRQFYEKDGVTRFSCFQRPDAPSNVVGTWRYENGLMGEFHMLDLRKEGDFSWVLRDEPLLAEDTYRGQWQVRDGAVHLAFLSGQTKTGEPITPQKSKMVLSIVPDDLESLLLPGKNEFRLERANAKLEARR